MIETTQFRVNTEDEERKCILPQDSNVKGNGITTSDAIQIII